MIPNNITPVWQAKLEYNNIHPLWFWSTCDDIFIRCRQQDGNDNISRR